jgi:glycosyltransferase involved in cell wall biosynthesis
MFYIVLSGGTRQRTIEPEPAVNVKVGTTGLGYVEQRNLHALPFQQVELGREYDVVGGLNYVQRRILANSRATSFLNTLHWNPFPDRFDLIHFVNSISASSTPWISTFSHYLPRWNLVSKYGMRLLASRACKKLIAISSFAFMYEDALIERFPVYRDAIRQKMVVVHPAQEPLVSSIEMKEPEPDVVVATIVGADFFRKGGMEILRATERLTREGYPLRVNIVSTLDAWDYASQAGGEDIRQAEQLIARLPGVVRHYRALPNRDVLNMLVNSHVGLLPTYDDIYGYSVLEAQAAGCPVISTDCCALPEINNDEIGWMIRVPKDSFGIAYRKREAQRKKLSEEIEEQLTAHLRSICDNPGITKEKGRRAFARITAEYRPEDRSAAIERIYREVMSAG